jgi:hypothetical protein
MEELARTINHKVDITSVATRCYGESGFAKSDQDHMKHARLPTERSRPTPRI